MIQRLVTFALSFVVLMFVATPASAQRAAASASAGPRLDLSATAMRAPVTALDRDEALAAAAPRKNMGQPVALMIVGGAAIVLGAVIGGDAGTLFMIGGAVAGLIGLYQYLQ